MKSEDLIKILANHSDWLNDKGSGSKADLRYADLADADLTDANLADADLRCASLKGADLIRADLKGADLIRANLTGANLIRANLADADLTGANLIRADLTRADLKDANLTGANLTGANLKDADLTDVKTNDATYGFWLACPEVGSFIAFKKAKDKIVVLEIPADARRSSATSLKCRCDKAKVLRIENLDGSLSSLSEIASDFDSNFVYKVGETVSVDDFDTNRWVECSEGIHFFVSRQLAVNYSR